MPTADDYIKVDNRWILKERSSMNYSFPTKSEQSNSRTLKVLSAEELWESPDKEIPRLWGDFLFPESIHLLSGETGIGKTTFLYNLAIKASRAEEFAGIPFSKPLRTLYLDLETPSALRIQKLKVIAEDKPNGIYFLSLAKIQTNSIELLSLIRDLEIDLVIVDTINEAFDTQKEDDNAEANRQMETVRRIVKESGCSVILIHHIGKGDSTKRSYKARGASARPASADVVLNLVGKSEDIICLETATNRWIGGINKLFLKKAGEDKFETVEGDLEDLTSIEKYKAQQAIAEYLKEQGESQRNIIVEALVGQGYKRSTLDRALSDLFQLGEVRKPKRGFYSLPA
jgi:predicted ATP-dependent serine protease